MATRPTLTLLAVVAVLVAATGAQPLPFPQPQSTPETVTEAQDFPYIPALPGARLISTKRIYQPLELKQAAADDEAVLAGMSYVQKTYDRPGSIAAIVFISTFRDALFAAGWKLIDVTRLEETPMLGRRPVRRSLGGGGSLGEGGQPETVNVAAHYSASRRNIYARMTQEPGGPYQVNVADVGAEDWSTALAKECRVLAYSIHFDLDRATLRPEATATLEKLAGVLKARPAPAVEVQGHMDNVGATGEAARQLLSEARARTVAGKSVV